MCGNKLILALDTRREIGTMSSGKGHENSTEDWNEHLMEKGKKRLMIWEHLPVATLVILWEKS